MLHFFPRALIGKYIKAHQPGLVPKWNESIAGGGLTCYAMVPKELKTEPITTSIQNSIKMKLQIKCTYLHSNSKHKSYIPRGWHCLQHNVKPPLLMPTSHMATEDMPSI